MHLIELAKMGRPLPPTLPPELVPPSFRRKASVAGEDAAVAGGGSVTPAAAAAVNALTEWAIPQQSKLKYTQMFNTHDRSRQGFLTGVQARGILVQSQMPTDVLAQVVSIPRECPPVVNYLTRCVTFAVESV